MKAHLLGLIALLVTGLLAAAARAETVKDREGAVRGDRAQMERQDRWIYNDVERGFAEAKHTGKPLLVTVRCVPCKACMGIDASILGSPRLQPLLDRFVCVRVINANALDLSLFQFDYDLSFSTLFFNADRTIYGRYGSWQHQRDSLDATTTGYEAALEAVLAIHQNYPANKASLAGKQGGPAAFKTPLEIPTLAGRYQRELNWSGNVVQSCVHCHQIGDAMRATYRAQGQAIPQELVYPMPQPQTIGLTLDAEHAARVKDVEPGSPAAKAGMMAADDLLTADGQPLVSAADLAWALHRTPDSGTLKLGVRRADGQKELTVELAPSWRTKADISDRHGTWQMRAMALGGLVLTDVTDAERTQLGLGPDVLALKVKMLGQSGPHGAAKQAGFRKDDVLVSVDGNAAPMTEGQLIGRLLADHPKKESADAIVLRHGERVKLTLPMQ